MTSLRTLIVLPLLLSACTLDRVGGVLLADTAGDPDTGYLPAPEHVDRFQLTNQDCVPATLGTSEYFFCTNLLDWSAAAADCAAAGFHLVKIDNPLENSFLLKQSYLITGSRAATWWTGGSDLGHEGTWTWTDGSRITYTAWHTATGEPNGRTSENCLQLNSHGGSGQWNDYGCSTFDLYYICEL
ncbi:MAG: C-type lectin domain-containing protein [Pseudomonadota bacterium]